MKRDQFLSDLRRWCRKQGKDFSVDMQSGKGSHIKLCVDGRKTIVKGGELSPVYIKLILKQLELPADII